jgi:hypothetical protein
MGRAPLPLRRRWLGSVALRRFSLNIIFRLWDIKRREKCSILGNSFLTLSFIVGDGDHRALQVGMTVKFRGRSRHLKTLIISMIYPNPGNVTPKDRCVYAVSIHTYAIQPRCVSPYCSVRGRPVDMTPFYSQSDLLFQSLS